MNNSKIIYYLLVITSFFLGIVVLAFLFRPFYERYINAGYAVGGDYLMHLSNLEYFREHGGFPISDWQTTWFAGYPVVEGYPYLHYYVMQPLVSWMGDSASAMEYYAIASLFLYFVVAFALFYYVAKNFLFALLLSAILLFGADSGMTLFNDSFVTFTASQFFMPLILLLAIMAHERESVKLWILTICFLSFAFYAHPSMTAILLLPALLPFLFFTKKGKIKPESLARTFKLFLLFVLLSSVAVYSSIDQALRGVNLASKNLTPLAEVPELLAFMFSWQNPVLLAVVAFSILLLIKAKKAWFDIKPYFFSLALVIVVFMIMVFDVWFLNAVIAAERRAMGVLSLALLLFAAALVGKLVTGKKFKIFLSLASLSLFLIYVYLVRIVGVESLMPKTFKGQYKEGFFPTELVFEYKVSAIVPKYKKDFSLTPLSGSEAFDNYRVDGLDYRIYHWWNLISPNPCYKGWYPALKGLPWHWAGLVRASEMGRLGEGGADDLSPEAVNQSVFWLDWYGIRHLQTKKNQIDLADYLTKPPLLDKVEKSGHFLAYYSLDPSLIGPLYAGTNVPTMAVVTPDKQYKNFIRTLSYTKHSSQKLIPIWLGDDLGVIKKKELKNFDAVFLYGYKTGFLRRNAWQLLDEYVKEGGKLIIETGQKLAESERDNLPSVFPVSRTQLEDISKAWEVGWQEGPLTKNLKASDLQPLDYKYLPFSISKASGSNLRDWAKPVLTKGEDVVMAYGKLGKGQVVWSGLNLPFHAVDNRNVSETRILANILDWFFKDRAVEEVSYQADHPSSEEIVVSGKRAKGVLIKEHWNPGWKAKLVASNHARGRAGKQQATSLKIYKAGLLEMYVFVPDSEEGFTVKLTYNGAFIYWLLFAVTVLTLVAALIYLVTGSFCFFQFSFKRKLSRPWI